MFYNRTLVVSLKIVHLSYRILRSCLTLPILLIIFNYSKSWQYCIIFQSLITIIIAYFPSVSLAIVLVKMLFFCQIISYIQWHLEKSCYFKNMVILSIFIFYCSKEIVASNSVFPQWFSQSFAIKIKWHISNIQLLKCF